MSLQRLLAAAGAFWLLVAVAACSQDSPVVPAVCMSLVTPASLSFGSSGGTATMTVTSNAAGCAWNARSNDAFIAVTAGATGNDNGSVTVSVSANPGAARTGSLTIAGTTVAVAQDGLQPNYAGTWTGRHTITNCRDVDPDPRLTHLGLCATMNPDASYRLTLSQSGTTVTGTYTITRPLVDTFCACGGMYGTGSIAGMIAPDGSLPLSGAVGLLGVGLQVVMTFNLRPVSSSPLVGTVSGELDFGGFQRATFNGEMLP